MSSRTVHSTGDSCTSTKILITRVCQLTPTPTHPPHFLSHSHIYITVNFTSYPIDYLLRWFAVCPGDVVLYALIKKKCPVEAQFHHIYLWDLDGQHSSLHIYQHLLNICLSYICKNNYLFRKYFIYYSFKIVINLISILRALFL